MSDDDVFRSLLPFALARTGLQYALGAAARPRSGDHQPAGHHPPAAHRPGGAVHRAAGGQRGRRAAGAASGSRRPGCPPTPTTRRSGPPVGAACCSSTSTIPGTTRATRPGPWTWSAARSPPSTCWPPQRSRWRSPRSASRAPEQAAGWYVDGGVRLNAPLQPAVGLGATRILLISATSTTYGPPPAPAPTGRTQDIADAAAQVLHAVLADRMVEDLATLRRINRLVAQAAQRRASRTCCATAAAPRTGPSRCWTSPHHPGRWARSPPRCSPGAPTAWAG